MAVKRMDNVGIVVEDLDAAIEFFTELGLALEGRAPIQGAWADVEQAEAETDAVAVRHRKQGDQGAKPVEQFIAEARALVDSKNVTE